MTDRPAVEAWLVCSEFVTVRTECLSVNFRADRYVNSSYYSEFDTLAGATFRYIVNYKTNDTAAQGIITMDLEAKRCDQHFVPRYGILGSLVLGKKTTTGQHATCGMQGIA